jgi:hypothetical protein
MRNYASFCGNWPVVPDGFESLRSLHSHRGLSHPVPILQQILQQMLISRAVVESVAPDSASQALKKQPDHREAYRQNPALDLYITYEGQPKGY